VHCTTGYYESGRVFFPQPKTAKWVADLEDELASFPGGLHDDCVDAISQAMNRMRDAGGVLGLLILIKDLALGKRKPVAAIEMNACSRRWSLISSSRKRLRRDLHVLRVAVWRSVWPFSAAGDAIPAV
jgi:hypothetical protein